MSKENVKILWLYADLLDLYGDRGNINAITFQLKHLDIPFEIDKKSIFDVLDFDEYDFIYVGPGKDKNVIRASEHLIKYKEAIIKAVNNKRVFLVTGNAQLLFGREIEDENGNNFPAVGLFDYSSKITGEVFINDMVASPMFSRASVCYGFINRTSYIVGEIKNPLFEVKYSEKNIGQSEGILSSNFFSTWCLGPVLAKNPPLLKEILCRILGATSVEIDDSLQNIALQKTLGEFEEVLK